MNEAKKQLEKVIERQASKMNSEKPESLLQEAEILIRLLDSYNMLTNIVGLKNET